MRQLDGHSYQAVLVQGQTLEAKHVLTFAGRSNFGQMSNHLFHKTALILERAAV